MPQAKISHNASIITNPNAPRVDIGDDARALSRANLALMIDPAPEFVDLRERRIGNRAGGLGDDVFVNAAPLLSTFSNGMPAFNCTDADFPQFEPLRTSVNGSAWTLIVVAQPVEASDQGVMNLVRPLNTEDETNVAFNIAIGFGGGSFFVYRTGSLETNTRRLSAGTDRISKGHPSIITVTGSTTEGIAVFDDGKLVQREAEEVAPLVNGIAPGSFRMFQGYRGLLGMAMIYNEDLSRPSRAPDFEIIHAHLRTKYDIPAP